MKNKMTINSKSTFVKKANLYKKIFGESSWNEGFICKNCGKIYNIKFMGNCNCGKSNLEPLYKNNELKKTFSNLSIKSEYKELIAKVLDEEIGFIWGWETSLEELNKNKLGLTKEQIDNLIKKVNNIFSDFNLKNFYYLAEIGVKNKYRGNDIAGKLYRQNIKEIKSNYIIVRTTKKTDVPYKWFLKEGYEVVYSYNDEQDRVILVNKKNK